jgi:hypothetical protein
LEVGFDAAESDARREAFCSFVVMTAIHDVHTHTLKKYGDTMWSHIQHNLVVRVLSIARKRAMRTASPLSRVFFA